MSGHLCGYLDGDQKEGLLSASRLELRSGLPSGGWRQDCAAEGLTHLASHVYDRGVAGGE